MEAFPGEDRLREHVRRRARGEVGPPVDEYAGPGGADRPRGSGMGPLDVYEGPGGYDRRRQPQAVTSNGRPYFG